MSDRDDQSLETQAEEASIDANVTIDEPTAPALDTQPDPNTEWEKAAADQDSADEDDSQDEEDDSQDEEDDSQDEEDDSGQS